MKANELRIGNLIYSSSGGVKYVVGTSYKTILHSSSLESYTYYEDYDSNCEPIPLTEEILLKCGAKKTDKEDSFGGFIIYYPNGNGMRIKNNEWSNQHITVKIEFLHQLQNLYWCLCGKELTFNNL